MRNEELYASASIMPPPLTTVSLDDELSTMESHVMLHDTEEVRFCFQRVSTVVISFNKNIELIDVCRGQPQSIN